MLAALALAGLFFAMPAHITYAAGPITSIELVDLTFTQCNQPSGSFQGSFRVLAKDADGVIVNATTPFSFRLLVSTEFGSDVVDISVNSTTVQNFAIAFPSPQDITTGTVRVALALNPGVVSPPYIWDCATGRVIPGDTPRPGGVTLGEDDRLNLSQGELMGVLYARPDNTGRPGIHVYILSAPTTGTLQGIYPNSDFARFIGNPPRQNTRIRSIGKTTLYALTTGEFQINIGPDENGRWVAVIFDGVPPTNVYYR